MYAVENSACATAFKEWAVICAALATGEQSLILRKGGIHEGRAGFRVAHREFWLLPTQFHAAPEQLLPGTIERFATACQPLQPTEEAFVISLYARVEEVIELQSEAEALALTGLHFWSDATVQSRFHYKQPGLYLLQTRIFASARSLKVLNTAHIAGCRSWVELPEAIDTFELSPVLSDDAYRSASDAVRMRLRNS